MDFVFGLVDSDSVFWEGGGVGGGFKFYDHSRQFFFQLNLLEPKAIFQADPTK